MKFLLSRKPFYTIFVSLLFCCFISQFFIGEAKAQTKTIQQDVDALKSFVDSGLAYIKEKGADKAYQEFNNSNGKFRKENLYIFVLSYSGKVFAHGGDPKAMVGKNLFNAKDKFGTPFFQLFADAARRGGGVVSYYWPRPDTGVLQYKTSYIEPIDGKTFIGAGIYKSPAVPMAQEIKINDLKKFVDSAAEYVKQNGSKEAHKEFNNPRGKFIKGDWYIFVIDRNGKMLAHGGDPKKQVGLDTSGLTDQFGAPLLTMFAAAAKNGGGLVSYYWYHYKEGGAIRFKTSYIEPLDDQTFIGAGYYQSGY
ncbi:MAG TPA: hypothetical protein DCZ38_03345 [Coxiellaceae bacterium]|nr:hypothetical protein [Coxiellaceae bacterium]